MPAAQWLGSAPRWRTPETDRFVRYAIVGATGTLVDFAVLMLLKEIGGFPTLPAAVLAFLAGVVNNYTLNRRWTFAGTQKRRSTQLAQFLAVSLVGVLLNSLILLLLEDPLGLLLGDVARGYLPAKVVATGVVLGWNYLANRRWTFNDSALDWRCFMTATALNPAVLAAEPARTQSWLTRRGPLLALALIVLLAAGLRFSNLAAIGDANTYYTASVEAMLQSPSNFFFAAAEPGGSVTVDKPPVGLWLQAISAAVFGVSGASVALPQILAGIASVALMYALVRPRFGVGAGLAAALVMAVMPVNVAVDRNNTMDSTLILTLLLAAWAFLRATERASLRWLLVGGVLVGVGFNIKMLQAFLPLPAFLALYLLGAKLGWGRKLLHLGLALVVLLAFSLSWAVVVELTPAANRPYIGSTQTNSVFELILGYNGIERLLGMEGPTVAANSTTPSGGMAGPAMMAGAGGAIFSGETGEPGLLRLLTPPLAREVGWLLVPALLLMLPIAFSERLRLPFGPAWRALVLWGGWLATAVVFFSAARFFHAYYLAMLTPSMAALIGVGLAALWGLTRRRRALGVGLALVIAGVSLAYQVALLVYYAPELDWRALLLIGGVAGALLLIAGGWLRRERLLTAGLAALLITLVLTPLIWSIYTVTTPGIQGSMLPSAYDTGKDMAFGPGTMGAPGGQGMPTMSQLPTNLANAGGAFSLDSMLGGGDDLLAYLQQNTGDTRFMVAVISALTGSGWVLDSGRGVLYLGGFTGTDPVAGPDDLAALVTAGDLRYVYDAFGMLSQQKPEVVAWLQAACVVDENAPVPELPGLDQMMAMIGGGAPGGADAPSSLPAGAIPLGGPPPGMAGMPAFRNVLYDCAPASAG